jgi:hypothetical protein
MKTQTCKSEQKQGPQARSRSKNKQKRNTKQEWNKKLKDLKAKHKRDPKQLTNNI